MDHGLCLPVHGQSGSGELAGEGGLCVWGNDVYWVCGTFFFLPETKNRTALELDELFERRIPAWDVKKYTFDDEGEIDSPRKQVGTSSLAREMCLRKGEVLYFDEL